jgi:hypothetical protein
VAPGVEATEIDGEVLVFDGEMMHLMSGSGAQIWHAVDGRRSADQIIAELASRHTPTPDVEVDTRTFLDDLLSRGLVIPVEHRRAVGFEVPRHVAWTTDGPLVVLLDLAVGERQTLSHTASRAWMHLADGLSLDEMLRRLAQEFADAPPSFAADTEGLVRDLCDQGLHVPTS